MTLTFSNHPILACTDFDSIALPMSNGSLVTFQMTAFLDCTVRSRKDKNQLSVMQCHKIFIDCFLQITMKIVGGGGGVVSVNCVNIIIIVVIVVGVVVVFISIFTICQDFPFFPFGLPHSYQFKFESLLRKRRISFSCLLFADQGIALVFFHVMLNSVVIVIDSWSM